MNGFLSHTAYYSLKSITLCLHTLRSFFLISPINPHALRFDPADGAVSEMLGLRTQELPLADTFKLKDAQKIFSCSRWPESIVSQVKK
jgi:hypothetical protein